MFVSNNTMVITEEGSLNAGNIKNDKIYTTDGYENFEIIQKHEKTNFIKTDLFPTITIGEQTELLIGRIYSKNNSAFIKNQFIQTKEIKTGDYIIVPKTRYKLNGSLNRTICWLYAKYIISGYYCTEKQTDKDMIVINVKKMSKKEALRLRRYADIKYDMEKMLIIIKNQDIIELFGKDKKHLIKELYNVEPHIIDYFLHTMKIENETEFIAIDNKTLAYDLFMFFYSTINKIMTITEQKDESKQKLFYLKESMPQDYILFNELLYVKINNILIGKEVSGIEINNIKNKRIHGVFVLIK